MTSKSAIAGVALVGVLGLGVLVQTLVGGEEPTEPDAAAPTSTVPLDQGPADDTGEDAGAREPDEQDFTNEDDPQPPAVKQAPAQVASDAMVAYTEYSYADPDQHSWIDRVAEYGTEGFHHNLEEQFGVEDPYWDREVVPEQRQTRTTVDDVEVSGMHDQTASEVVYTVTYRTSLKTKDMSEWGVADPMTMWVYLDKQGGQWLVTDIIPTNSRSDQTF